MSVQQIVKPVKANISDVIARNRVALGKKIMPRSQFVVSKGTLLWIGAGVLALAFSGLARRYYHRAGEARKENHNQIDRQLDRDLEDTMDASDAVAKY
jgi:hypothetical protein